ncbi:MAG TPA: UDP-N-acetylglucosamine 2-epimerase (non-hydrolyzing) [Flavobacteriales bacterium]|nr:UDP-N-acetylglucosamine 2-epimerase (non-hydrolyzing) [Flavobacteriales bacterium]
MKIVTVIGARPQFIKAAAVSHVLRKHFNEVIVHTGQHYDVNMSEIFFNELDIPKPDYHFETSHGEREAQIEFMAIEIGKVLEKEQPNFVLVYGDTNSTLAGAKAATKSGIPLIHVEAGLRSFNNTMPEEKNRVETDHLSTMLFVPTKTAMDNLRNEGITKGVFDIGDVMYDAIVHFTPIAEKKSRVLEHKGINKGEFLLCTIHRAENTNDINNLKSICEALNESGQKIVLPLHPRTLKCLKEYNIHLNSNVTVIDPVGYLDMLMLEKNARKIITDSGGIQKEAFFMRKPCITLRNETEWVETVECGWNLIVGTNKQKIKDAIENFVPTTQPVDFFSKAGAAGQMAECIKNWKSK